MPEKETEAGGTLCIFNGFNVCDLSIGYFDRKIIDAGLHHARIYVYISLAGVACRHRRRRRFGLAHKLQCSQRIPNS